MYEYQGSLISVQDVAESCFFYSNSKARLASNEKLFLLATLFLAYLDVKNFASRSREFL